MARFSVSLFPLYLLLVTKVGAEEDPQFIEVSGSWYPKISLEQYVVDGIYEKEGQYFHQRDGYKYLRNKNGHWEIVDGDKPSESDVEPWYRNTVKTGSIIPRTGWELVFLGRGRSTGNHATGLQVSQIQGNLNETIIFGDENLKLDNGILCNGLNPGSRLYIATDGTDPRDCDKRFHCKDGFEEQFCPQLLKPSPQLPLFVSLMVVGCGLLIHIAVKAIEYLIHPAQDITTDVEAGPGGESIRAICKTVDKIIRNETMLEVEYDELHRQDGGLQLLIGRVAKCHGYDGYIRVKNCVGWTKKFGRTCNFAKSSLFG